MCTTFLIFHQDVGTLQMIIADFLVACHAMCQLNVMTTLQTDNTMIRI